MGRATQLTLDEEYDVGATLGQGAFGEVKKATHKLVDVPVAIKYLRKDQVNSSNEALIQREISVLRELRHPHIIRLYEVLKDATASYLVFEFLRGGELLDLVVESEAGFVDEDEARPLFVQVVRGIQAIHARKIVHRDIKLENICLSDRDTRTVKIIDFGLGAPVESDGCLSECCGSPCYAAPEMILGERYDYAVDVWALGVTLYAMVCGYFPFEDDGTDSLFQLIVAGEYELPDDITEELADLLEHLLELDPVHRITLEQCLAHPWVTKGGAVPVPAGRTRATGSDDECDGDVLRAMLAMGFSRDDVVRGFADNALNLVTSTYCLLCELRETDAEKFAQFVAGAAVGSGVGAGSGGGADDEDAALLADIGMDADMLALQQMLDSLNELSRENEDVLAASKVACERVSERIKKMKQRVRKFGLVNMYFERKGFEEAQATGVARDPTKKLPITPQMSQDLRKYAQAKRK